MDRMRVLRLAQEKQLKKGDDASVKSAPSGVPSKRKEVAGVSSSSRGGLKVVVPPLKKQKPSTQLQEPLPAAGGSGAGLGGSVVDLTTPHLGGDLAAVSAGGGGGRPLVAPSADGSLSTERCTILRFRSGSGWLGSGAGAPMDALGAFALSPDRKSLEGVKDEEVYEKASDFQSSGFLDCVRFVGYGNVMDSERHTLDLFHQAELASLAPQNPEETVVEGSGGTVMPEGPETEAGTLPDEVEGPDGVPNME